MLFTRAVPFRWHFLFTLLPLLTRLNFCSIIELRKLRLLPQKGMPPVLRSYVASPSPLLLLTSFPSTNMIAYFLRQLLALPLLVWPVVACLMQRSYLRLFRWKGACPHSIPVTLIALQLDYPLTNTRGSIVASRRQRGEHIR